MTPIKYYIVDETTLQSLLLSDRMLSALENGGVDNWSWYGESFDDYVKWSPPELIDAYREERNIPEPEEIDSFDYMTWEARDEMKTFKEYKMDD